MAREETATIEHLHNRRKKRRKSFLLIVFFAGAIIFATIIVWMLYLSPFARLEKIIVVGNKELATSDIEPVLVSIASQTFDGHLFGFHALLAWPRELSSPSLRFLPGVEHISFEKHWGDHAIVAQVVERIPYGIWCSVDQADAAQACWWFDVTGFIFKRSLATEGQFISVVNDTSKRPLGLGFTVLPARLFANLLTVFDALKQSGVSRDDVRLTDLSLEEVTVVSRSGPKLYYSLRFPATNTVSVVRDLRKSVGFRNLEYIDFRVENRAYYR